jgi:hypothetical protein
MAQKKKRAPKAAVERNIALTGKVTRYLMDHPEIFKRLPDDFEMVILPDDDPEMRRYNLELLETFSRKDKPIVFVRLQSDGASESAQPEPRLYVPLAA